MTTSTPTIVLCGEEGDGTGFGMVYVSHNGVRYAQPVCTCDDSSPERQAELIAKVQARAREASVAS